MNRALTILALEAELCNFFSAQTVELPTEPVAPADANSALLCTLVHSMMVQRPGASPEEIANFIYGLALTIAQETPR